MNLSANYRVDLRDLLSAFSSLLLENIAGNIPDVGQRKNHLKVSPNLFLPILRIGS